MTDAGNVAFDDNNICRREQLKKAKNWSEMS
jgi:hypothetical protein